VFVIFCLTLSLPTLPTSWLHAIGDYSRPDALTAVGNYMLPILLLFLLLFFIILYYAERQHKHHSSKE